VVGTAVALVPGFSPVKSFKPTPASVRRRAYCLRQVSSAICSRRSGQARSKAG